LNYRTLVLLIICAGIGVLVWFLAGQFPGSLNNDVEQANLVRSVGILVLIAAGMIASPRLNLKGAMKHILVWVLIGLFVLTAYTLRDDFKAIGHRMGGELAPSVAVENSAGDITIQRSADGHFHIIAVVNGTPVQFMIDTGASVVTLTPGDAARVGINPAKLTYNNKFETANGSAWGASVKLDRVTLDSIALNDVRASVIDSQLGASLLGMSFLDRLSKISVEGDTMTLKR